jgi:hypothetical protein
MVAYIRSLGESKSVQSENAFSEDNSPAYQNLRIHAMSSGAHTHDLSGAHLQDQLYYNLPAYDVSICVIFVYRGKDQFELYFVKTSAIIGTGILESEGNMIFKVPPGFTSSFKIIEVATGARASDQGKYLVTMELHPPLDGTVMKELEADMQFKVIEVRTQQAVSEKQALNNPLPVGICSGSADSECPGTFSPCELGQVLRKENGVCGCYDPEGPQGG